jgi:hypothetical protein
MAEHCHAECHLLSVSQIIIYTECRYASCRYAECLYAECRGAIKTSCWLYFMYFHKKRNLVFLAA